MTVFVKSERILTDIFSYIIVNEYLIFIKRYAIYNSHEIEVVIYPTTEGSGLSDADIDAAIAFLTNVQFTPVEK